MVTSISPKKTVKGKEITCIFLNSNVRFHRMEKKDNTAAMERNNTQEIQTEKTLDSVGKICEQKSIVFTANTTVQRKWQRENIQLNRDQVRLN